MLTGGCRCGAVRYTLSVEGVPRTYACHCTRCQRSTGASFAHQMPVREDALTVTGEVLTAPMPASPDIVSLHRYCSICFTRLYNTNSARPGMAIVRAGTLDGSETLTPRLHIYTSTKQPWIALPDDVPAYDENAPMDVWVKLFA
ncbi:GFA family protein [Sphingomonas sp. AOB5]|uniref:GFA family protein n=1 Tax=Sphingomonas sp. AOB5 TaxID=3034017 RepID=UPI0023FA3E72|nr:GFA family protein [Sphingomonas sp. AOB5]MDF7776526.1 GFA family protein [Sphingomonas sp. AOB5]